MGAAPHHGEVMGPDHEPVGAPHRGGELGEDVVGHLDHGPAHLAQQVLMRLVGQVVDGAAMPEMYVVDDAEGLERVERPVDGGEMHVRDGPLDRGGDVLGTEVVVLGVDQRGQQRPAAPR